MEVCENLKFDLKAFAQKNDFLTVTKISYRSTSLNRTIKKILKDKKHFGITRVSDITELDIIGIPVISTIRPSVDSAQITATQGKGLTIKNALASALMEAVERTAAANYTKIKTDSTENLLKQRLVSITPSMLGGQESPTSQYDWVNAVELFTQQKVLIPAADVIFPYYPGPDRVRPFRPSTTGLAAGNTFMEALFSSINEVIERQATSSFMHSLSGALLETTSIQCPIINALLKKFRDANVDVIIVDLSKESPIPVFYVSVLSEDARGTDIACAGQAAHIIPEVALRRALLEAAQSRAVAIQGSREDLIRHATDWQKTSEYYQQKRQELKKHLEKNYGYSSLKISHVDSFSTYSMTAMTLNSLLAKGYKNLIVTDLTEEQISIPVTHVIIPGMVDTIIEPTRKPHQISKINALFADRDPA